RPNGLGRGFTGGSGVTVKEFSRFVVDEYFSLIFGHAEGRVNLARIVFQKNRQYAGAPILFPFTFGHSLKGTGRHVFDESQGAGIPPSSGGKRLGPTRLGVFIV